MPSEALATIYASAPTDAVLIPTLEVLIPGSDPIRVCNGYQDQTLTLENSDVVEFLAGNLVIELPERNDTGKQTLKFGLWNVSGDAQVAIELALESADETFIVYREYDSRDLSGPASQPQTFTLVGGTFEGLDVQFEASYYDILNTAWPRERYNSLNAPGIRFL